MKIIIEHEVDSCRLCPNAHNTSWNHDDPFTAAPEGIWKCNSKNGPKYIRNASIIDPKCPLNNR